MSPNATGANLFIVRGDVIVTPSTESILEGVTRSTLITLAGDLGLDAREARISRDHLYGADEVFVCGTAAEVLGVVDIDGRRVGDGRPGAVTTRLQHAYSEVVHGRHARSDEWLDYVNVTTESTVRG